MPPVGEFRIERKEEEAETVSKIRWTNTIYSLQVHEQDETFPIIPPLWWKCYWCCYKNPIPKERKQRKKTQLQIHVWLLQFTSTRVSTVRKNIPTAGTNVIEWKWCDYKGSRPKGRKERRKTKGAAHIRSVHLCHSICQPPVPSKNITTFPGHYRDTLRPR